MKKRIPWRGLIIGGIIITMWVLVILDINVWRKPTGAGVWAEVTVALIMTMALVSSH